MTPEEMRIEMYRAMVNLLGRGYQQHYYEQAAQDFIEIADQYARTRKKANPNDPRATR